MLAKKSGQGRARTGDTCIFSAVLYQLSYLTKCEIEAEMLRCGHVNCQSVHANSAAIDYCGAGTCAVTASLLV
jgi:precorrin-4 methylase